MMILNDDQRMLADTVRPFMAEEGAVRTQLRHWRDTGCTDGFGTALWKQFAELGLTGMLIPEGQGGAGLGIVEAGCFPGMVFYLSQWMDSRTRPSAFWVLGTAAIVTGIAGGPLAAAPGPSCG